MKATVPANSRMTRYSTFLLILISLTLAQCNDGILDSASEDQAFNTDALSKNLSLSSTSSILPGGSLYDIQLPNEWKDLVIYNHGYVNPQEPLSVPDDDVEGQTVASIVNQLGFAYAAASYRANGLVGPEAVQDIRELLQLFIDQHGTPDHIFLVGVSEGALVTTLAIEKDDQFSGGVAACGPVGNFERQLDYLGDFHVLFNFYFPGLVPGDPTGIPDETVNQWLADNSELQQKVKDAIRANPRAARTLLQVADVPVDNFSDPDELRETIFSLLRYNILATNNAILRLSGQPYDNQNRFYSGTGSFKRDLRLNRQINRFSADASALSTIENEFETSGDLSRPLIMTHTTGDQEVPYWHEPLYRLKAFFQGSSLLHSNIPVVGRFGHCNFELSELLTAFSLMVVKVTLQDLLIPPSIFDNEQQKKDFQNLARKQGIEPVFKKELQPNF